MTGQENQNHTRSFQDRSMVAMYQLSHDKPCTRTSKCFHLEGSAHVHWQVAFRCVIPDSIEGHLVLQECDSFSCELLDARTKDWHHTVVRRSVFDPHSPVPSQWVHEVSHRNNQISCRLFDNVYDLGRYLETCCIEFCPRCTASNESQQRATQ